MSYSMTTFAFILLHLYRNSGIPEPCTAKLPPVTGTCVGSNKKTATKHNASGRNRAKVPKCEAATQREIQPLLGEVKSRWTHETL